MVVLIGEYFCSVTLVGLCLYIAITTIIISLTECDERSRAGREDPGDRINGQQI